MHIVFANVAVAKVLCTSYLQTITKPYRKHPKTKKNLSGNPKTSPNQQKPLKTLKTSPAPKTSADPKTSAEVSEPERFFGFSEVLQVLGSFFIPGKGFWMFLEVFGCPELLW